MRCGDCGLENRSEAAYCARCGAQMKSSRAGDSSRQRTSGRPFRRKAAVIVGVGILATAALVGAGVLLWTSPAEPETDASSADALQLAEGTATAPQVAGPAELRASTSDPSSSVIFVVDFSGSMFDVTGFVRGEIIRAIRALSPDQSFSVICFSDTTPKTYAGGILGPATHDRKESAIGWIESQFAGSHLNRSDAGPALEMALDQRPDELLLLSDGVLSQNTLPTIRQHNRPGRTRINTMAIVHHDGEKLLKEIAREFLGRYEYVGMDDLRYRYVEVSPPSEADQFIGEPVEEETVRERAGDSGNSINIAGITHRNIRNVSVDGELGRISFYFNGSRKILPMTDYGWIELADFPKLADANRAMQEEKYRSAMDIYLAVLVYKTPLALRGLVLVNLTRAADRAGQYADAVSAWVSFQQMGWSQPQLPAPRNLPPPTSPDLKNATKTLEEACDNAVGPHQRLRFMSALLYTYSADGNSKADELQRELAAKRRTWLSN